MRTHHIGLKMAYVWLLIMTVLHGYCLAGDPPVKKPAGKTRAVFNYTISGATGTTELNVLPYNASISLQNGDYWDVSNGTIVFSNPETAYIQWGSSSNGNGEVRIRDASGQIIASLAVGLSLPFQTYTCSPAYQIINYNTQSGILSPNNIPDINCRWQWQQSADGVNFGDVSGATTRNWQPPLPLTATTFFRRVQRCGTSPFALPTYSLNALVVIGNMPLQGGTLTPATQDIRSGNAPVQFTLTGVSGGSGTRNYLWQYSADQVNWTSVPNNNFLQYTHGILFGKTYFRVVVSTATETVTSTTAVVNVDPPLASGSISPASITIDVDASPGTITGTPATGGQCASYTYQWQQSADNTTFVDIPGATGQDLVVGRLTATTFYRRKVFCGGQEAVSNTSQVVVNAGTVTALNYVRVREFTKPVTDAATAERLVRVASVKQTTQYMDGLGRPIQSVSRQANPAKKDIVTLTGYDNMGREAFSYLPYVSPADDGIFRPNALNEQVNFNGILYPGEQQYYSKVLYENSPLARVTNTYSPGASWGGSNRGSNHQYAVNTPNDFVKKWIVNDVANDWGTYSLAGEYTAGELFKTTAIDEDNKQIIEFKDKSGNVIFKKVQVSNVPSTDAYTGWLCTYYLYDVSSNLRLVIQPAGVELLIQNNWNINALNNDILNEQCFRYEYDNRNLLIRKKMPGAGETWMVYDKLKRLVLSQDANQRAAQNQWLVSLYDKFNRVVLTGLINYNSSLYDIQQLVTTQTSSPPPPPPGIPFDDELNMETSGLRQALNSISMIDGFSTPDGGEFIAEIVNAGEETDVDGVTVHKNPIPPNVLLDVLTKTGYDTYATIPAASGLSGTIDNTYTGSNYLITSYNVAPAFAQPVTQGLQVRNLTTWEQRKVQGSTSYVYSVNIYDEKGQPVQIKSKNITGGTDVVTTQYSFSGMPLVTVSKTDMGGSQTHIVVTKMEYDDGGYLIAVKKSVNSTINGATVSKGETTIRQNEYDALGQIKTKSLGLKKDASGNYTSDPLEKLAYEYNVRGWLLGMNRDYLSGSQTSKHFGFELGYDKNTSSTGRNFTAAVYNGNINGMQWKSAGDGVQRKYDYAYDAVNRLLRADFEQHNADGSWNNNEVNYNVKMGDGLDPTLAYDANGNIRRMQQWGLKIAVSEQIDDLRYTYYEHSNKLKNVVDIFNDEQTKLSDFRTSAAHPQKTLKTNYAANPGSVNLNTIIDYTYDANGNMKSDLNKDLGTSSADGILYNYMSLPEIITVRKPDGTIKGTITYTYDAGGNKCKKIVVDNSTTGKTVTTTTIYLGQLVFASRQTSPANTPNDDYTDQLQFIAHEEGRIRYLPPIGTKAAAFEMDYFIRDHVGNIRMVLTEEKKQDIYPAATLEGSMSSGGIPNAIYEEQKFYTINTGNIADRSEVTGLPQYVNKNGQPGVTDPPVNNNPASDVTAFSQKLYRLQASGNIGVTGLGITLKVMSGDYIDIFGKSYYFENNNSGANYEVPVLDVLSGLLGAPSGGATGKGATAAGLNNIPLIATAVDNFLDDPNRGSGTKPKAYINWIVFDENFKYVKGGFSRVGDPNGLRNHFEEDPSLRNIEITKNGYLYVYCSNESPVRVYFDNLQVVHTRGPVVEETHYYPFGLVMNAISSRAMGITENKFKANSGNELNTDLDIDLYETAYRNYDPQIGRFHQMDPMADDYLDDSPYNYGFDNPVFWSDPLGADNLTWDDLLKQIEDGTIKPGHYYNLGDNTFGYKEIEAVRYDEDKQRLIVYFPQYVTLDAEGHEIAVTTRKPVIHDVPEKYRPFKESGWDYVPVVGSARKAYDHFKKGRWIQGIFHTLVAASDVVIVKALVTSAAKAGITAASKYVLKRAIANPSLTAREAWVLANTNKRGIAAMMRGKGIDRAFREMNGNNVVLKAAKFLKILRVNSTTRGADMVGRGFLKGTWWDITTRGDWAKHVAKYGEGGIPLFY